MRAEENVEVGFQRNVKLTEQRETGEKAFQTKEKAGRNNL